MLARLLLSVAATALFATSALAQQAAPQQARPSSYHRTAPGAPLVEDGYYTNRDGIQVHRPAHTTNGQPPAGASAQCGDGSFSFSLNRRGTCSHHGGVTRWL